MTVKTQVLLLILLLAVLAVIIHMVKKRQLELKYVLVWLGSDIVLIIFTCFPGLMDSLANLLGIYSPMNMIFFLGFLLALVIIFSLTVALSRVTEKVRRISQILAMLPEDILNDITEDINGEQGKDINGGETDAKGVNRHTGL